MGERRFILFVVVVEVASFSPPDAVWVAGAVERSDRKRRNWNVPSSPFVPSSVMAAAPIGLEASLWVWVWVWSEGAFSSKLKLELKLKSNNGRGGRGRAGLLAAGEGGAGEREREGEGDAEVLNASERRTLW